jgi:hypothetical protein
VNCHPYIACFIVLLPLPVSPHSPLSPRIGGGGGGMAPGGISMSSNDTFRIDQNGNWHKCAPVQHKSSVLRSVGSVISEFLTVLCYVAATVTLVVGAHWCWHLYLRVLVYMFGG